MSYLYDCCTNRRPRSNVDADRANLVRISGMNSLQQRILERFKRRGLKVLIVILAVAGLVVTVFPQKKDSGWPEKPVNLVVGFAAGGGADAYARILSKLIHDQIGMPMAVINKTGAAGMIALKYAAGQESDGYTVLLQVVGAAVAKELIGESPVDFRSDMRPIAILGLVPAILAIPIDSPFDDARDFFSFATEHPGQLRWASPGRGGILHVAAEKAFESMNVDIKDVPFRGGSATKAAVVAAQVDVGMMSIQHYKGYESRMRVLGLFADERDARFPAIQTFKEQGLDIPTVLSPFGVYVRSETPDEIVQKLHNAVKAVTETDEYRILIRKAGLSNNYHGESGARKIVDQLYVTLSN